MQRKHINVMENSVIWDTAKVNQCFGMACCLLHVGLFFNSEDGGDTFL
jgi:hypothetical protein